MVDASLFAATARDTFDNHQVPFRAGGTSLSGMDSSGFIVYCLQQNGIAEHYSGTNDLYRNGGNGHMDLGEAVRKGLVIPGVLLLHVDNDGLEPQKYKADQLGNCDYAMICIDKHYAVYPSASKGELIKTEIKLAPGRANILMYSKHIAYPGRNDTPASSPIPQDDNVATVRESVRLRHEATTTRGNVICEMPAGAHVNVLGSKDEWTNVRYYDGTTQHEGWCMSQYLNA